MSKAVKHPHSSSQAPLLGRHSRRQLQPLHSSTPAAHIPAQQWHADPEELAKLSARVAELASGITDEQKQIADEFSLQLPNQHAPTMVQPTMPGTEPAHLMVPPQTPAPKPQHPASPALTMVRNKLEKLYAAEPDPAAEAIEAYQAGAQRSKHQQYMLDLTNSGKSVAQIQVDWHNYYASLTDAEKHEVWQEFYQAHSAPQEPYAPVTIGHQPNPASTNSSGAHTAASHRNFASHTLEPRTVADIKKQLLNSVGSGRKLSAKQHLQSLLFGVGVASLVVVLLLFSFFNERFLAPFISPSRQVSATPIVGSDSVVGKDPKIIIPKINLEVPVIYGINTVDEKDVQNALEDGVVHYSSTPLPGEQGNVVIVGHSSNNILNKGKYKFAFVLLKKLENGDTFSLNKDGVRYTYQVYKKEIVKPTDVSVLGPAEKPNSATLITCDPPGTSLNRLIVVGEQISPNPSGNKQAPSASKPTLTDTGVLPSNAPSLWQRITGGL